MVRPLALSGAVLLTAAAVLTGTGCGHSSSSAKGGAACQALPTTHVDVPWMPSALGFPAGSYAYAQSSTATEQTADFVVKGGLKGTIDYLKREWPKGGYRLQVPDVESDEAEITASGPANVFVGLRERFCDKSRLFARVALHPAQP